MLKLVLYYITLVDVSFDEIDGGTEVESILQQKAEALQTLLPFSKAFGNVTVFINIIPCNTGKTINHNIFEKAFKGNPAFAYTVDSEKLPIHYVVFKNKVVQYFNDALNDAHGVRSTLYQEIAKNVFGEVNGTYFCTDLENKELGMPLGEWP